MTMKVTDDRQPIDIAQNQLIQNKKGAAGSAAPFDKIFREKSEEDANTTLNRLLELITEQGERIANHKDINDVKRYRELVSNFLDEATRSAFTAEKEGAFDARGRYKEYAVVKRVNTELEKLTKQVLDEQKDNLSILEQLGTIRGLLIDLLV